MREDGRTDDGCVRTRRTVMDDGIALSAVLERPAGTEHCPLVIVLHGFSSSKDRPHNIAACRAMHEAGFATLRADLYGHGESGGEFRKHTLHKWISNTIALIDDARKLDFVTEILLSGHSQGGLTAALAGAIEADRVSGLILRAPAFMIPRCAREGCMLGVRFDPLRIPDEIPTIKDLTLDGNYIRIAQTIRAEDAIGRYTGPVLLLHGSEDDVVPPEDSVRAAELYRNCRLEIISGETHHFDRDPERMRALIRGWLTDLRSGTVRA
ncbi:MAG: alpha/beta fold hydrolase [Clostridia bacterium]|nr:alpha/beta fold hydrolase [Clostridia bacterium]